MIPMGLRFRALTKGGRSPQTVSPPLIRRLGMSPRWQSATLTTRLVIVVSLVRGEPKHRTFLPWTGRVAVLSPTSSPTPNGSAARYDRPLLSSGGGEGPALLDSLLWRRAPLRPFSSSALSLFFFGRVSSKGEIVYQIPSSGASLSLWVFFFFFFFFMAVMNFKHHNPFLPFL